MKNRIDILVAALAALTLLLAACQAAVPTDLPAAQPTAAPTMAAPTMAAPTDQPQAPTQPPANAPGGVTLDLSGVAQDWNVETIAAVSGADGPWWDALPEYRRISLEGYPVTDHLMKPQIFIFPAADLPGASEAAGKTLTVLQALLQARQPVDDMPFLPMFNAAQVMHAQVQYLDFHNGTGARFLTQYDQAPLPINNYELIYTFQGLTSDGKYYIAAILPVTHPDLPDTQQVSPQQAEEMNDFQAYMARTVAWLEQQPAGSFTPDLSALDALVQSIEVQ
jgi:hypothetical protein